MKIKIDGFLRLARYKEYLFFVIVTTFLGASAANGTFGWNLVGILVANWLAVAFAFMINDVEDAEDDALNPEKIGRNPVSARVLSRRSATIASWIVAAVSLLVFASLGLWPFIIGVISIAVGYLYSWRGVRLKNIAFVDMISHCMMLAGLQFLGAYVTFEHTPLLQWIFPFLFVTCISLYGELFNEMRDLDHDLEAGLRHTAATLGPKVTYRLMMSVLAVGVASGLVTFFVIKLVAPWVIILLFALAALFLIAPLIQIRRHKSHLKLQESFQKPFEIAAAFALTTQFVLPWAARLLNLG